MNHEQKNTILVSADLAFVSLMQQIDHMLDMIHFFMTRYPPNTASLALKHESLKDMVSTLGTKPAELAEVIRRWKRGEDRLISWAGVQSEMLNELWITLDVLLNFFSQEGIELHPYNHFKARRAFNELVQLNRIVL